MRKKKGCSCWIYQSYPALLWPHGQQPTKLLCPWGFPGKNAGVGCHFFLQGIFRTSGSKMYLLLGWWILYHWATRKKQRGSKRRRGVYQMAKLKVSANRPSEAYQKKVDPDAMTYKRQQTWQPSSRDHSVKEKPHTSDSSDCFLFFVFFMCSLWDHGMTLITFICLRLEHINYCHTINQLKTWWLKITLIY